MIFPLSWKASKDNGEVPQEPNHGTCISDCLLPGRVESEGPKSTPVSTPHCLETMRNHAILLVTPYTLVAFISGAMLGAGGTFVWRRWLVRIRTAEWVTPDILARKRWVKGVVTRWDCILSSGQPFNLPPF